MVLLSRIRDRRILAITKGKERDEKGRGSQQVVWSQPTNIAVL